MEDLLNSYNLFKTDDPSINDDTTFSEWIELELEIQRERVEDEREELEKKRKEFDELNNYKLKLLRAKNV